MRKKQIRNMCWIILFFAICCFLTGKNVQAEEYNNNVQKSQTSTSVTIGWKEPYTGGVPITSYRLYLGKDYNSAMKAKPIELSNTTNSYTFKKLRAGSKYYVIVAYVMQNHEGYAEYADLVTLPAKVWGAHQSRWYNRILKAYLSWGKQEGASGYEYLIKNNKNKVVARGSNCSSETISTMYTTFSVKNNMSYKATVRAYIQVNGKKYYGAWSDVTYLFSQPEVSWINIKKGKLTVKWQKINGVTGYDIYISTKKNTGYKKVRALNAKSTTATISKFKNAKFSTKKTYYVYIAAKKTVGKKTYNSGKNYVSSITRGRFKSNLQFIN